MAQEHSMTSNCYEIISLWTRIIQIQLGLRCSCSISSLSALRGVLLTQLIIMPETSDQIVELIV